MSANAALSDLAERYWRFECAEAPLTPILAGVPCDAEILFREAPSDYARRDRIAGEMLAELDAIPGTGLVGQERATHSLLRRELASLRAQYAADTHLRPWLLPAGPDFNTVFFANSCTISTPAEAALYVKRLESIPEFLVHVRENLAAGYAKGIRYPRAVLEGAVRNTRGIAAPAPIDSPWYGPFKRSAAAQNADIAAAASRALAIIGERIIPALHTYAEFMSSDLAVGARENLSCVDAPGGKEYYSLYVKHFTTTDMGPEEVHEIGLAEVARLEREIAAVAAQAGYGGDVKAYRTFLSTDPQFLAGSAEELRQTLESLCKRVDLKIPAFFKRVPRITYGVDIMPAGMSETMPPAYAQPSAGGSASPGVFWASSIVAKVPSYMHVPLVVHEAWPGHLMHIALLQELEDLPAFRRYGAVKYTACIEGWALYCEGLAVDMGFYATPHQHYGRLEMEMWRAVRLVVDTGIHWHDWSRDQAIAYMSERLALDPATIAAEVDRYAALPGQALAYQIGNLKMRELRARAEATLGARFTHRDYHDAIMSAGAVTLPVLDDLITNWLARESAPRAA
jgi:uncharacterized protein (DUF885 family)